MNIFLTVTNAVRDLIDLGGPILLVLFVVCLLLWSMILERLWFIRITWPARSRRLIARWLERDDLLSWRARKIRESVVSEVKLELHAMLPLIQALVALCPLLGLLGTVLGMISVFEVIAVSGNNDAQAMASGIYRATIPTMAGLVVALTGIYFTVRLRRVAARETSQLQDQLTLRESTRRALQP